MASKHYIKFSLNTDIPQEQQLYDYIKQKQNISGYLKDLITADINKSETYENHLSKTRDMVKRTIIKTLNEYYTDAESEKDIDASSGSEDTDDLDSFIFGSLQTKESTRSNG